MWRKVAHVAAWSVLLFVVLPFVVKTIFKGSFADGVLMGTGVAIVWYTLETLDLRRETARLREASSRQIDIMSEQKEATIRPLLISRVEDQQYYESAALYPRLVLRNIGHGPALFAQIQVFTVNVWTKGDWRVESDLVDLVEPGKAEVVGIRSHVVEGPGPSAIPTDTEIADGLRTGEAGNATTSCDITITYEDVQKRCFESVMRMGRGGTRLVSYRLLP